VMNDDGIDDGAVVGLSVRRLGWTMLLLIRATGAMELD
jgi:hypothetical protein